MVYVWFVNDSDGIGALVNVFFCYDIIVTNSSLSIYVMFCFISV